MTTRPSLAMSVVMTMMSIAVGVLGCARTPATVGELADPTRAPEPAHTPAGHAEAAVQRDGVTLLLDPGALPHAPLRYHLREGQSLRWSSEMSMDMGIALLGNDTHNDMAFAFDVQTEVVHADASAGVFECRSLFQSLHVGSGEPGALAAYVGLESWTRMNDRGELIEEHYTRDGAPVDPASVPGLQDAVAPTLSFPLEPVGVGARWQKFSEVERNGIMVLQTSEHELVARDRERVVIDTRITQQLLSTRIQTADMPEGSYAELRSFETLGTGKLVMDLDAPVPVSYDGRVDFSMVATIFAEGREVEMQMSMQAVNRLRLIE